MAINSAPLNLLVFPQRWQPQAPSLSLSILVLPKGDPRAAFNGAATPFADADLAFDAMIVPSLQALPTPAAAQRAGLQIAQPANRRALFDELARSFNIREPQPGEPDEPSPAAVKKFLSTSYREATRFASPRTRFAVTDRSYDCALKDAKPATPPPDEPDNRLFWEEVLAFVLRQPLLARELGLIYDATLEMPDGNPFAQGGYLFADLAAGSAYRAEADNQPGLIARFAARIPPLADMPERPVFAAVLFPVASAGTFDEVLVEADAYDGGFARIVHGAQPRRAAQVEHDATPPPGALPPVKDTGIRLGWDDEQVAIWLNRQLGVNAYDSGQPAPGSPLGVAGYRVDVREDGDPGAPWSSLVHVKGDLELGGIPFGTFDGELAVEAVPVNHTFEVGGEFWLPSYFAAWTGGSLVLSHPQVFQIANRPEIGADPVYEAVDADAVPLLYGRDYQFRVRLMDLTGGGPLAGDPHDPAAPAPIASVPFRRFVPPGAVRIDPDGGLQPDGRTASYQVLRPLLGYPDIVYTGFPDAIDLLLADVPAAAAEEREAGLPDPDATHVLIEVQVRTLDGDPAAGSAAGQPFVPLYSLLRELDAEPLTLNADFEDVASLGTLRNLVLGDNDPLRLPTARDVRLVLTAMGSEDAALDHWGSQEARRGAAPVSLYVRAVSRDERGLFRPALQGPEIQAIFLQPDPPAGPSLAAQLAMAGRRHDAPSDLVDRLAHQLGLARSGLTLSARGGRRLVIGAARGLRHTLNPDRSSITFATKDDLTRHWLVCIRLTLDRDWTWDALAPVAFEVRRDGALVGEIVLPRAVNRAALQDPDRDHTEILFLDAWDPKPLRGEPLREGRLTYTLAPSFRAAPVQRDPDPEWPLTLPITTPPTQVPRLVSAGFAASEYVRDARYSATKERRRRLYLELDGPPEDGGDRYFARVLAYGPDPMLLSGVTVPEPGEPPLDVEEPIRVVTQSSSKDCAGLDKMQELIPSEDGLHYLLPLPEGMDPDSPELFGFFVYELRVGHDCSRWSTAQGRFGLPLRVAGVQHPAPQLRCAVSRTREGVQVTAPHAAPALQGRDVRPFPPRTMISALLYAQVLQADGQDWRNVLLHTVPGDHQPFHDERGVDLRFIQSLARFPQDEILRRLAILGLPLDASLSVVAVEVLPEEANRTSEPMASDLGTNRILRISPLTPVPAICPPRRAL